MFSKIKKTILISAATLALALGVASVPALAATCDSNSTADQIQCGVNTANGGTVDGDPGANVHNTLTNVIDVFSIVIGIIAVIVIIIAGLTYITSGGDSGKAGTAKQTILYAVIGLIVVAFAQLIVQFAINTGTPGNDITQQNCADGYSQNCNNNLH